MVTPAKNTDQQTNLHNLPKDHDLRNIPLSGCWYRWAKGSSWRQVKPNFGIAGVTFNGLGSAWTDNDVFCWIPEKQKKGHKI
ncbi:MAG: hypothetical protein KJZ90_00870 [Rhodocyclaceae bacterium]|nr:hypothetical protein [Rhodocyclaceae bacterium]